MACFSRWQLSSGISQNRLVTHDRTRRTLIRSKLEDLSELLKKKSPPVGDSIIEQKAMSRLRSILSSLQDTEDDMFYRFFRQIPTEYRLSFFLQISTLALFSVLGVCVICGMDPLGGMNIFRPDFHNGVLGLGAAIPPILVRSFLWNADSVPVVDKLRDQKIQMMNVLFGGLSFQDSLIVLSLVTICSTFVVYPGIIGCFSSSLEAYSTILNGPEAAKDSFEAVLVTVGIVQGYFAAKSCSLTKEETETITTAASNSDRYYRLTVNSQEDLPNAAEVYSEAFRKAVCDFLQTNRQMCALAGALVFGETIYAGAIWKTTSDLSTTLCFMSAVFMTDFLFYRSTQK